MKITVLCTDRKHPVIAYIKNWQKLQVAVSHDVQLIYDKNDLSGGDILFLVSCGQLINETERKKYRATLILHASDLPKGRGWSPHIWAIVNGESEITVCLLEASDSVDSGAVWLRKKIIFEGHELLPEINDKLFNTELELMSHAVKSYDQIKPEKQTGESGMYMKKRTPEDSRLDPSKTIEEQFNLLRIIDSQRYPAFMDYLGKRYLVKIEKDESFEAK